MGPGHGGRRDRNRVDQGGDRDRENQGMRPKEWDRDREARGWDRDRDLAAPGRPDCAGEVVTSPEAGRACQGLGRISGDPSERVGPTQTETAAPRLVCHRPPLQVHICTFIFPPISFRRLSLCL